MIFNSYQFLIFFPIVVLIYYVMSKKYRCLWLLVTSYYFYMCWDAKYALLIAASTVVTYFSGIFMDKIRKNYRKEKKRNVYCKVVVAGCCIFNLAILVFFKYFPWILDNINVVLGQSIMLPFSIVLPVGISFYTFQALGYIIDVYRGEIEAEKNLLRYALFVSFFPQLVAGPIERSKNLLNQLDCDRDIEYENVRDGLMLMLWGFFEKIVIADKAAIFVDSVYNNYIEQEGSVIIVATVLFAFQIYCDFGGYSHIAIGAAKVLNINLMDNFRQPYFALNIKDFWKRWHISLSSWFRDYLYIPLGGNRCSKVRNYSNLIITFFISGLWHGASWHYVVWGVMHGIYQIVAACTLSMRRTITNKLKIQIGCFSYRLMQRGITFMLICFSWLFFRAANMEAALQMCYRIVTSLNPSILLGDVIYNQGLNSLQMYYLLLAIIILIIVDCLHEKKISICLFLKKQNLVFRWLTYYIVVFVIILSVLQTFGQSANKFIYFQF